MTEQWTAIYARHHVRYEEPCGSLNEALAYLWWGEDSGEHTALAILDPSGKPAVPSLYGALLEYGERRSTG